MKNQKGFTLVEMAIVLVIIGLLLGGVLKGQELIESSRIKNAANDINGVIAAYNGYVDRFRAVPGDDGPTATLTARSGANGAWSAAVGADAAAGGQNGQLADASPFATTGENFQFWVHTRAAGFIAGNPKDVSTAALPRNAFGGLIGVTASAIGGVTPIALGGTKLCLGNVPGKAARALDIAMDDGISNTGIMRGFESAVNGAPDPTTAATAYSDDSQYTICRSM